MDVRAGYNDVVREDCIDLVTVKPKRVLDFGGGNGATCAAVKARFLADECLVIDVVDQEQTTAIGLDRYFQGDILDDEFYAEFRREHGGFDLILALDVLEHIYDPWEALKRLKGLLNPGGEILVSLPNASHWSVSFDLFWRDRFQYDDAGLLDRTHIRFFGQQGALELVAQAGLKLVRVDTQYLYPKRLLARTLRAILPKKVDHLWVYRRYFVAKAM